MAKTPQISDQLRRQSLATPVAAGPLAWEWFTGYWQWWLPLFWLAGYEIYALITHRPTLSRLVWRSAKAYPWSVAIVVSAVVILLPHFYVPGAEGWTVALTGLTFVWIFYSLSQKAAPMPIDSEGRYQETPNANIASRAVNNEPVITFGVAGNALATLIVAIAKARGFDIGLTDVGVIFAAINTIVSLIQRARVTPSSPVAPHPDAP